MIDKAAIKKYVYDFLPMSSDSCQNYQAAQNIHEWPLNFYEKVNRYINKNDNIINVSTNLMIKVSSLNFKYNFKYKNEYVDKKPLKQCVSSKYLYPFILFINNKFIKWDNISICTTFTDTYLYITNISSSTVISSLKIYNIPFEAVLYDNISFPLPTMDSNNRRIDQVISFDSTGNIITDYDFHTNMSVLFIVNNTNRYIIDNGFFGSNYPPTSIYKDGNLYILNNISNEYNIMPSNIIFINNGLIDTTSKKEVFADNTIKITTTDISTIARNGYIIVFDTLRTDNSNIITKYNNIPKEILYDEFINTNSIESIELEKKFSLNFDKLDGDEYTLPFYARLMEYDPYLYSNLYLSDANINRISSLISIKNTDIIPYGIDNNNTEMGLMIFNNGLLESYTETNNSIRLIDNITNSNIDIIRFKNIQNNVLFGRIPTDANTGIEISELLTNSEIKFRLRTSQNNPDDAPFTYYWGEIGSIRAKYPSEITQSVWETYLKPNGSENGLNSYENTTSVLNMYEQLPTGYINKWWIMLVPADKQYLLDKYEWYQMNGLTKEYNLLSLTNTIYTGTVTLDNIKYYYSAVKPLISDAEIKYSNDIVTKYLYDKSIYIDTENIELSIQDNKLYANTLDTSLYDKKGIFYNTNQFRHEYYNINLENTKCGYVLLSSKFDSCDNLNRYMVFYNGRLMTNDDYIITLYDKDKPYYEQRLYPLRNMITDDRLDVFYIPYDKLEYIYNNTLDISGNINITSSNLYHPLDKSLILVFINGRLVSEDDIENINTTTIRILNSESIRYLTVMSFIKYDSDLLNYFNSTISSFDNIESKLSAQKIISNDVEYNKYDYFKGIKDAEISNIEEDSRVAAISNDAAWLSISRDFYNTTITNIDHHLFENTIDGTSYIKDGVDPDGNDVIPAYYANLDANYDIYTEGNNLAWKNSPSTNNIYRATGIGNNVNSSLAIHTNIQGDYPSIPTEYYNGISWVNKASIPENPINLYTNCGCGTVNNCIITAYGAKINKFNGSVWVLLNNTLVDRNKSAMIGNTSSALLIAGNNGSFLASTEKLSSNVWASDKNINISRSNHTACGEYNASMIIGGKGSTTTVCEIFNGTSWANSTENPNTNRNSHSGNGILNNTIIFGGLDNTGNNSLNSTEIFDGNTWSVLNIMNSNRYLLGTSGMGLSSIAITGNTQSSTTNKSCETLCRI